MIFIQVCEAADEPSPLPEKETSLYSKETQRFRLDLSLSAGVRFDQLQWNTAAVDNSPNILSELEWRGILSHQLTAGGYLWVDRIFYSRGHINYAWIQGGTVRDSDYGGDDHTQEWSRSISETNGDQLWDVVIGGGYPFTFKQKRLLIAPMLGSSLHRQNLRITNGRQVVSETPPAGYQAPPALGPLNSRLNSMYSTRWFSLWAGCDLRYQMASPPGTAPPMEWGVSLAYHFWADYEAEADWNLRGDLQHPVSFRHDADAQGVSLQAQWLLRMSRHWHLQLDFQYCRWFTDAGTATIYQVSPATTRTTRLNEVTWESRSVMLGATYLFF